MTTLKVQYRGFDSDFPENKIWQECFHIENELHFQGSWLVTAGAAINNPDHVFLSEFSLHDGGEPVR
jgi:hypothetical protein